ncbi:MAG TPA: cytochrome c oxidase subunit II [Chloroflexota bacterium]
MTWASRRAVCLCGLPAAGLLIALVVGSAVASADSSSPLTPASAVATATANLFWVIVAIAGIIFVGVEGVLFYALFAYRQRPGREAAQFHGSTWLEITWTAIPALILLVVFVLTVKTVVANQLPAGDPLEIRAVAHQWWWEFDYPAEGITTANELHVPVGERVVVKLSSVDVIHSFWIPSLVPKLDAVPGQDRTLWFDANQAGDYAGRCAEFCGVEHTWMLFRVVAQSPDEYAAWIKAQQQPAPAPTGLALQGQQLYQAQTCASCHAIAGSSSNGIVGPSLTHVASRWSIGAGVLDNTPDNLSRWLADPQAFKSGSAMPNYHFGPDDVKALTAYLETLK